MRLRHELRVAVLGFKPVAIGIQGREFLAKQVRWGLEAAKVGAE